MIGDGDRLRLVLNDEDRVPLIAKPPEQIVHPRDVVRMQPDRGLVEHVGDIGQRGAEMANHLDPLSLTARQRSRCSIEGQVAEANLDERVEGVAERFEQWGNGGLFERTDPHGEVADLHRAGVGDVDAVDL